MNTKDKLIIQKLAKIVTQQQTIINKLAQQVVDTSKPQTDPLGTLIHDVTTAWASKNGISANSKFNAGADGKKYYVDVELNITDPRKSPIMIDKAKQSFLAMLQTMFDAAARNSASPLVGSTAQFDVVVK